MPYDASKLAIPQDIKDKIGSRMRAGTSFKLGVLERSINDLPLKYDKLKTRSQSSTKLGLTGLGNYAFGDDPSTPQIETDAVYRADNRIGDRETSAVKGADASANARGMQFSSFRDKNVGDALGRLSREAQQVMTQYAGDMGKLVTDQNAEETNLYDQMRTLYGDESSWVAENPPAPTQAELDAANPPAATEPADPNAGKTDNQKYAAQQGWLGPWNDKPALDKTKYSVFQRQLPNGEKRWFAVRK